MRILFILLFTFFITQPFISNAQSVKEMQAEMQNEIKDLKKHITDLEKQIATAKKENPSGVEDLQKELTQLKQQLSLMEQSMKNLAKMPSTLTQQVEKENNNDGDIPGLDKDRIKQIPDKILSNAELTVFVKNMQVEIEKKILPLQKTQAALMFSKAKENGSSPAAIGNMASLCWMNGYAEIALYLMDKACLSDMTNADNLNNLSAFLTMTGGEHLALPILDNLNAQYPNNSTILNNMGQAWFGLGDMLKAKNYLEKAVMYYAIHSQANKTLCKIYKSEGNKTKAVQAIKNSMKKSYSSEKEDMLNDLGEKMGYDELVWKYPKPAGEPLGLDKFLAIMPEYPMNVSDAELKDAQWQYFIKQINNAQEKVIEEIEQLEKIKEAYEVKLQNPSLQPSLMMPYNNPVWKAAIRKLLLFEEWKMDKSLRMYKKREQVDEEVQKLKEKYMEAMEKQTDGIDAQGRQECAQRNALANTFMSAANTLWHDFQLEFIKFEKQSIQEEIGYLMYTSIDPSFFELYKARNKSHFLSTLTTLRYEYVAPCITPKKPEGKRGPLPDFDDVNCQYKTELSLGSMFSIKVECNKMTTKFDLPYVKAEIVENLNTNKSIDIIKGSVEISQGFSKEIPMKGPIKAEVEAKVGAFVEFDNSGITDVGITGEAGVKMETQNVEGIKMEDGTTVSVPGVNEQKVEMGVGVRTSWNAGTTVSGTGIFQGTSVSFK